MHKDRVQVFNRLMDGDELTEVTMFEELVGKHYRKFCYAYNVISNPSLMDYVDDMWCTLHKKKIDFHIKLTQDIDKDIQDLIDNIIAESAGGGFLYVRVKTKEPDHVVLMVKDMDPDNPAFIDYNDEELDDEEDEEKPKKKKKDEGKKDEET